MIVFESADALACAVAQRLGKLMDFNPRLNLALSGGRIAERLFTELAKKPIPTTVQFFWADERCVPPDHPDSNYSVAKRLLFNPLQISNTQQHRIWGELPPLEAAQQASETLKASVPVDSKGSPRLDCILLGVGEDGHIASLFPGFIPTPKDSPYLPVYNSPKPPPQRVTLSFGTILSASQVWVLASGSGKRQALQEALRSDGKNPLSLLLQAKPDTMLFSDTQPPLNT